MIAWPALVADAIPGQGPANPGPPQLLPPKLFLCPLLVATPNAISRALVRPHRPLYAAA
jgi:hypothetical protein